MYSLKEWVIWALAAPPVAEGGSGCEDGHLFALKAARRRPFWETVAVAAMIDRVHGSPGAPKER